VGFPTDTVYGLGAIARDPGAVAGLSRLKGRSHLQPLIAMAAGIAEIEALAVLDRRARDFASRFWPGPLTLILPSQAGGPDLGGEGKVAVRVPSHPIALALVTRIGILATTSANRHGQPTVASAAEALRELPGLAGALEDPGATPGSAQPSSILDLTRDRPVLLREGRLSARELGVSAPERDPGIRRD
jgi:L-threonylcarbamoyladenylate synthase